MFSLVFYCEQGGKMPVKGWLDKLDPECQDDVIAGLKDLRDLGNELLRPQSAPLREGIRELRVKSDKKHHRILYFLDTGKLVVLLHGLIKKTRKVPERDIKLAIKRKKQYKVRYKQDNPKTKIAIANSGQKAPVF